MQHKIGIVGGSGYVGNSLGKYLSGNFKVKVLDVKQPQKNGEKIEYAYCDVRLRKDVEKGLRDVDLVIHAAIVQIPLINKQRRLSYDINIIGTQNVCEAVDKNPRIRGMILTGSWHTVGEKGLKGIIDEEFGFRPDKVEDRARLYALSKIAQESVVRFYDEMSDGVFGIIRMGTVLGEGMPEKTAANIFIERGLRGETITPYKHSMHRPMLYVDINDICRAFEKFALKILKGNVKRESKSLDHIVNVYYPEPLTILELAEIVQKAVIRHTHNVISPKIEIVDLGQKTLFNENDKKQIKVNISKAVNFLGLSQLKSPEKSIEEIIKNRIRNPAYPSKLKLQNICSEL